MRICMTDGCVGGSVSRIFTDNTLDDKYITKYIGWETMRRFSMNLDRVPATHVQDRMLIVSYNSIILSY